MKRALLLVLASTLAACSGGAATSGTTGGGTTTAPTNRSSAPDFALPSLEGKTVRLSDHAGKNVVLVDFWSTTCDPCLAEMPYIVELYKKYKDKGFVVLAISADGPESRAQVANVVHDKSMEFPVLVDEETSVLAKYNPKREMPFSVLIGKDGSILEKHAGYQSGDEVTLAKSIEKALAE